MAVLEHEAFCLDSLQTELFWWDHFDGDQIKDEWRSLGSAGGSAVVVDQQTGGICRITTNNVTNDFWYIDWGDIRSLLVTKRAAMEVRIKLTQLNAFIIYIQLTRTTNDRMYFEYDNIDGANWFVYSRDGGVITSGDSGIAADTSYHRFRIQCEIEGGNHAHYYIDNIQCGNSPITTNIPDDPTDYLQPRIRLWTRENVAKTSDCDYVAVRQDR